MNFIDSHAHFVQICFFSGLPLYQQQLGYREVRQFYSLLLLPFAKQLGHCLLELDLIQTFLLKQLILYPLKASFLFLANRVSS
jgi:hypothetical protein